jgi:hypothetical protein
MTGRIRSCELSIILKDRDNSALELKDLGVVVCLVLLQRLVFNTADLVLI